MIILIRSIQVLECIMSKDIENALECYKNVDELIKGKHT